MTMRKSQIKKNFNKLDNKLAVFSIEQKKKERKKVDRKQQDTQSKYKNPIVRLGVSVRFEFRKYCREIELKINCSPSFCFYKNTTSECVMYMFC